MFGEAAACWHFPRATETWVPWQKERGDFGCIQILAKDLNFAFVIVLLIVNVYAIYNKITNKNISNSNTFLKKKNWKVSILENIELVDEFEIFWGNKNSHRAFLSYKGSLKWKFNNTIDQSNLKSLYISNCIIIINSDSDS